MEGGLVRSDQLVTAARGYECVSVCGVCKVMVSAGHSWRVRPVKICMLVQCDCAGSC